MDHQNHDSKMMWGMMLACGLPILLTSIVGSGRKLGIVWAVMGIGLMFSLHWVVMKLFNRHQPPTGSPPPVAEQRTETPKDHNQTDHH